MKQVVRCFLKNNSEEILLVMHPKSTNWTLPWWHIEDWENIYDALKREIKEEFNLDIEIIWKKSWIDSENIIEKPLPIAIYEINYISNKYGKTYKQEIIFEAKIISWNIKIQKEEIADYKFFKKEEILKLKNTFPQIKTLVSNI